MTISTRKVLADLHEIFLDFECQPVAGCKVVFLNPSLPGPGCMATLCEAYSYMIKPSGQRDGNSGPAKIFKAERYGGDGILNNGGGARCGFDGIWQLKGLGANPLVGHDVDAGHGDGNLSLVTAFYETIWAEIIQAVLPYGAARSVAILDTGLKYETMQGPQKRALLVREPVVRPAHFIRSIYFKQKRRDTLGEDAQRVKEAINKLVDFLPDPINLDQAESLPKRLKNGLIELAGRYAKQFAAARAKHIIHYNVSASNVSIQGGWLDLSGVCLFTDFINGDRLSLDRFNREYQPALQSIHSLCYYLSKYAVVSADTSLALWEAAAVHFRDMYTRHLRLYQASQAGFPLWLLICLENTTEFQEFSRCLDIVLQLDNFSVTPISHESGWEGYVRWTFRLYLELLNGCSRDSAEAELLWLDLGEPEVDMLRMCYRQLFEKISQAACARGISSQNLYRCMVFNVTRLNHSHQMMHDLKPLIEAIDCYEESEKKSAFQRLNDDAVLAARFNLGKEHSLSVPFWLCEQQSIWFDPLTGIFMLEGAAAGALTAYELLALSNRQINIRKALDFYRGAWNEIHEETL